MAKTKLQTKTETVSKSATSSDDGQVLVKLTPTEKEELHTCEETIDRGWGTFIEVGHALAQIREKKLHKETHVRWEDYCRERWLSSKTHANRLIQSAQVVDILKPIGVEVKSEWQARCFVGMGKDEILKAGKKVLKLAEGGKISTQNIEKALQDFTPTHKTKRKSIVLKLDTAQIDEIYALIGAVEGTEKEGNTKKALESLEALRLLFGGQALDTLAAKAHVKIEPTKKAQPA